jgi:hypothetical protein
MPQLHVYVPDAIAKKAHRLAEQEGVSVSKFLARLLIRELGPGWPDGYFDEVVGSWQGEALERGEQGELPDRDSFVAQES